jgi:hypothetical protein
MPQAYLAVFKEIKEKKVCQDIKYITKRKVLENLKQSIRNL